MSKTDELDSVVMPDVDEPLHVKVARALGCNPVYETYDGGAGEYGPIWRCLCPVPEGAADGGTPEQHRPPDPPAKPRHIELRCGPSLAVARYDISWYATGPLIEKYEILLAPSDDEKGNLWIAGWGFGGSCGDDWIDDILSLVADGPTPLVAVCRLILALKESTDWKP